MANLELNQIIQKIKLRLFLEKGSALSDNFKNSNHILELKKINKPINLPESAFEFDSIEFKRYSAKDYIDNEKLCENYLTYCAIFENAPAPAILITIEYPNNRSENIKITGEKLNLNVEEVIEFILKEIVNTISEFFN